MTNYEGMTNAVASAVLSGAARCVDDRLANALRTAHPTEFQISSLLQSRYAKSASDLGHLRLCERLTLFNSLFHGAQHNFLEKFDVIRIDNFLIDLDCNDIARAVRCNLYLPATGAHFDSLFLKLSLRLAHLLLHLLSLFH